MSLLGQREVVKITELSELFEVSQNTVRRDLKILADKGFLSMTHGGAVATRQVSMGIPIAQREIKNIQEKQAIGLRAAELIDPGDSVILDAGTTTSPMKAKGVGELGICGVGAAVANAIYNAVGVRVRDYPITLDKLLADMPRPT